MVIIQQQYVSLVILQSEAITLSFQSAIFSNKMKDDFIGKNNDSDIHAPDILSFWILTVCQDNLLCAVSHFLIVELKHLGRNKAALLQLRNSVPNKMGLWTTVEEKIQDNSSWCGWSCVNIVFCSMLLLLRLTAAQYKRLFFSCLKLLGGDDRDVDIRSSK